MRMLFVALALLVCTLSVGYSKSNMEVPYTFEDRERLIRVEERLNNIEKRLDSLEKLVYAILGGVFGLIVIVIWDRRTAISPVANKVRELEDENRRIKSVLKGFAEKHPELWDDIKRAGL